MHFTAEELKARIAGTLDALERLLGYATPVRKTLTVALVTCIGLAVPGILMAATSGAPWWMIVLVVGAVVLPAFLLWRARVAVRLIERSRGPAAMELSAALTHTSASLEPIVAELRRAQEAKGRFRRLIACGQLPLRLMDLASASTSNIVAVGEGLARAANFIPWGFGTALVALPGGTIVAFALLVAY